MTVRKTEQESEYPFFGCSNLELDQFTLNGKYSFQYVKGAEIRNSSVNTKDACWHSREISSTDASSEANTSASTSKTSNWFAVKLSAPSRSAMPKESEMIDCDLAFERSDVYATIFASVESIKNLFSGRIVADQIGETIFDNDLPDGSRCAIEEHSLGQARG